MAENHQVHLRRRARRDIISQPVQPNADTIVGDDHLALVVLEEFDILAMTFELNEAT